MPALRPTEADALIVVDVQNDFCVAFSGVDASRAGLQTVVIEDACRGIDANGSLAASWARMHAAGVKRIDSSEIAID